MTKEELKKAYKKAYDEYSETVTVYNYEIKRPSLPPIDDIENYMEVDQDERVFNTLEFDKTYTTDEVRREWHRRKEGHFFFNGDDNNIVLEYVTGDHYMTLQHYPLNTIVNGRPGIGHGNFVDAQRDVFYVWDLCKKDPNCYGLLFFTFRRFGKSLIVSSAGYWDTSAHPQSKMWIQARDNGEATEMYNTILNALPEMNPIWKPEMQVSSERILFGEYASKKKKGKKYINSTIMPIKAEDGAIDGKQATFIWQDEVGKILKPNNFVKRWSKTKYAMSVGSTIIGKAFCVTTVEEMEDGGGEAAKTIWDTSNYADRQYGRTDSGLFRLFLPADYGYVGNHPETGEPFVNKWGYSNRALAKQFHLDTLSKANDEGKLDYRRKHPLKEEDMFIKKNTASVFSLNNLYQQREYNDELPSNFLKRGNFIWDKGEVDGRVVWMPDDNGRWTVVSLPDKSETNQFKQTGGQRSPIGSEYVTGVDPIDNAQTADGRNSFPASMTYRKFNPMEPSASDMFVAVYNYRPPFPELFYDDMIKQAKFYNSKILVESNKIGMINYFRERGYYEYLLDRPEESHTKYSRANQKEKGLPNSGDAVRMYLIDKWTTYIAQNVGRNYENDTNGKLYFNEVIEQLIEFKYDARWTPWDLVVAGSLALAAASVKPKGANPVNENSVFRKYRRVGNRSVPITNNRNY